MKRMTYLLYVCLLLGPLTAGADTLRIAVAANFSEAMKQIAAGYMEKSGHRVKLSSGSTGKHYAQIRHGAPFDLFFAADSRRPMLLEQEGRAVAGSRFTYAYGQLALWSPQPDLVDAKGRVLAAGEYSRLAMANPRLAPYGAAAEAVLVRLGLWSQLQAKLVRGENIGQAYQFVLSGNAELGFVALSQIQRPDGIVSGSYWRVPQEMYPAIQQQAVVLKDTALARDFVAYLRSPQVAELIKAYGYRLEGGK